MNLGKRIMIMGSPCSGKSTFAVILSELLKLPVVHLDKISIKYINNGAWDMMNDEIHTAANQSMWIIEGNFTATRDYRLERADTVIYLDFDRYTCLSRLLIRRIKNFIQPHSDRTGCPPNISLWIIKKIWRYPHESHEEIKIWLLKVNPQKKVFHLKGSKAVKDFLNEVQQNNNSMLAED